VPDSSSSEPTQKNLQQYIAHYGYEAAVAAFSALIIDTLPNREAAYLFTLEELDAARQGNEFAMHYAEHCGIDPAEYLGALDNIDDTGKRPNAAQQALSRMAVELMTDRELAAKFKCDIGDAVMRHFEIGG